MSEGSNRPRSALADGAERMGVLARTAGERQLAEHGVLRVPATDVYSTSPDEAWSRRFMSLGIGPTPDCAAPGGYCALPFAASAQAGVAAKDCPCETSERQAAPAPAPTVQAASTSYGQIGQAIGKPPRRSWFRRGSP